jgi:hypothetical protein
MKPFLSFAAHKPSVFLIGAFGIVFAPPARAQVMEADGTKLPQPAFPAEVTEMMSRGFPADSVTLDGLFKYRGETINPVTDAHLTPATFSPQCGFTGEIVLHGGGCQNALGWYNATDPATTPSTIYVLVPANLQLPPPMGLGCGDNDFCPLATHTTTQAPQHSWTDVTYSADNIRNDPHYKGGLIGFALMAGTGLCTQTKYSQYDLGVVSTQYKVPWVTQLVWQSTVDPSGYYIGFEDLPMTAATWKGANNGNDGDFNDFVFYVSGLDCEGGGLACDTGMPGICAGGTTQCSNGGMDIKCRQDIQQRAETCNLLDDDCDGVIDNPDAPGLCPGAQVCSRGVCINPCSNGEFRCGPPTVCDDTDGLCKDPRCMKTNCGPDQICDQGVCVGGCDGVVCPPGEVCRIGNCVDPCEGITCGSGQVCEGGACLAACGCRNCPHGKTCSNDGTCVDTGCDKLKCTAPMVCVGGKCQDGCAGVQCPAAQMCTDGHCALPDGGIVVPPPDGGVPTTGTGGSTGTGGRTNTGGATGAAGSSATGAGGTGSGGSSMVHEGGIQTCSCDTSSGPGASGLALLLAAFGIAAARRRVRAAAPRRRR